MFFGSTFPSAPQKDGMFCLSKMLDTTKESLIFVKIKAKVIEWWITKLSQENGAFIPREKGM